MVASELGRVPTWLSPMVMCGLWNQRETWKGTNMFKYVVWAIERMKGKGAMGQRYNVSKPQWIELLVMLKGKVMKSGQCFVQHMGNQVWLMVFHYPI